MKFYFPERLYDDDSRWHIFPLLKAIQNEPDRSKEGLQIVNNEIDSDVVILPMSWDYYYKYHQIDKVLNYYLGLPKQKTVISFVFGDFGCKVPKGYKGLVFRVGGRKSKLPLTHNGIPVFIDDPVKTYFAQGYNLKRPFSTTPIVGFCGQARGFGLHTVLEVLKRILKNILSVLGLRNQITDQIISTTYFRWNILNLLKQSKDIKANFIIRKHYRAGITTQKEIHPTTLEFYNNIKDSDYVVCVRGAGNFSTRLYETLAMGRIPIFINTDCLLPLEHLITWKDHVVWIEYHERHLIVEKILEFHKSLNDTSINALFLKNRIFWKDYLQLYPFFNNTDYEN